MILTKQQIIQELKKRFQEAKENLKWETKYEYGYHDALGELLEWINENEN
jgi:hypothetical protein